MLSHKGTVSLTTTRMTLRRFTPEDAEPMYHTWASDPRVTRYLTWNAHTSPDETRALLADWCTQYERKDVYNWVMELNGGVIGNVSVVLVNERSRYAVLGYCMGADYWGKGLMTEAVRAVLAFLFDQVGFHRVELCHAGPNPASGAVARKCGMTCEGTQRQRFRTDDGEYLDLVQYGILREDWERNR